MSSSSDEYVQLGLFWGGDIIRSPTSVRYDRGVGAVDWFRRDSNLADLIARIYQLTGVDGSSKVKAWTPWMLEDGRGLNRVELVELNAEHNLRFFLNPIGSYKYLELYLEFEPGISVDKAGSSQVEIPVQQNMKCKRRYSRRKDSVRRRMQIFVKNGAEKTVTLEVNSSDTINKVKAKIQDKAGIPEPLIYLIYSGKCVESDRTLADCGIRDGSTLRLCLRAHA